MIPPNEIDESDVEVTMPNITSAIIGADTALRNLRDQHPDVPEHVMAFMLHLVCAVKVRRRVGSTAFRKRWYQMNITARAFAEMMDEEPPSDTADIFRDIYKIYKNTPE